MGRKVGAIWLAMSLSLVVMLSACGTKSDATPTAAGGQSTIAASSGNADSDVTSGCWKAADRGSSGDEGNGETVAHQQWKQAPAMAIDVNKTYTATIETSAGTITVEFYPKDAPNTVNNFVCLARAGYYDGTPFHRIIDGFVIQGGDPTGTGAGGPGYKFADEPITKEYVKGTLAMANSGPNTNGSQFFICTADLQGKLGKNYTIFGQVTGGMDVVDKLNKTPVQASRTGEKSAPISPVTLIKATVSES